MQLFCVAPALKRSGDNFGIAVFSGTGRIQAEWALIFLK